MLKEKINSIIEENKPAMLELLGKLVAVPSVAEHIEGSEYPYGKPCAEALDIMIKAADEMGFAVRNYEYRAGAADWSAEMGAPELGILSHLDVVPVMAENWTSDPFTMIERDGNLYGRGTIDNKGPAVAALYALYAVRKAGVKLNKNVRLLFGCDEESGSSDIAYYLTQDKMPPMVFTPDGNYPVIHIEKGMIRFCFRKNISDPIISMNAGTVPNAVPAAAQALLKADSAALSENGKLSVTSNSEGVTASYTGLAAHASTPEAGDNAITALMAALGENEAFADCKAISMLFPHGCTGGEGLGIAKEDKDSGRLTCVLSMMSVEDGKLCGTVDIRYPVNITKEEILETMQARFSEYGFDMEVLLMNDPHCVPEESEFVQTLLSVYEEETGDKGYCIAIGGGTYVHEIEGGVAFGAELPGWDYHMHGDDEFFPIDQLMMTARMIAAAIVKLCSE